MDKSTLLTVTDALLNAINTHGRLVNPVTGQDAIDINVITDVLCQILNELPENKDMLTSYSIAENADTGLYEKSIKIE
jgi:hypothetical protein